MTSINIKQIDTANKKEVNSFLHLPELIYQHTAQWVPPLRLEAKRMVDTRRNPFFTHSSAAFFLALDSNDRPLARLACLNHRPFNEYNHQATAFFYLFESIDREDISIPLFESAFDWARKQGLTNITGPRGFSVLDGFGLLSEGFEFRPALGIPYNHPYYPRLVEQAGFCVTEEIVSGSIEQNDFRDPKIELIAQRVKEKKGLAIAEFLTRGDLRRYISNLQSLYNDAIRGTSGNYPISKKEAQTMANQILWFSDPSLIKIVVKGSRPVGFLFAYPDISAALQRTKGRLFPIGWLEILLELRKTKTINLNGAGMIEEYRGSGGTAILFNEILKSITRSRYQHGEIVQINANNQRMLQELSNFGITFNKKHLIYSRSLD